MKPYIEPSMPTWMKWMIGIFAIIGFFTTLDTIDNSPLGRWWDYGDNAAVAGGVLMLLGFLAAIVYAVFFVKYPKSKSPRRTNHAPAAGPDRTRSA